jgi:hypothetical protein
MNWKCYLTVAAVAGGFALLGGEPAYADERRVSAIDTEAQVGNASPSVGVTICGNSVAALGAEARSECDGTRSSSSHGEVRADRDRDEDDGALSAVEVVALMGNASPSAGATMCGNSIAVGGARSNAACDDGGAASSRGAPRGSEYERAGEDGAASTGVAPRSGDVSAATRAGACSNGFAALGSKARARCETTAGSAQPRSRRNVSADDGADDSSGAPTMVMDLAPDGGLPRPPSEKVLGRGAQAPATGLAPRLTSGALLPLTGASPARVAAWSLVLIGAGTALGRGRRTTR